MSEEAIRVLAAALQRLNIQGHRNTVSITITSVAVPKASSSTADSQNTSAERTPTTESAHLHEIRSNNVPFYVIAVSPKDTSLIGVWEAKWRELVQRLPGGALPGSGCRPCRGFDTLEKATEYWCTLKPKVAPTFHRT